MHTERSAVTATTHGNPPMANAKHISILDPMRGVAALAVVLFHYTGSVLPTIRPNALTDPMAYGKLGVQVFFVISGFVIPYALQRSGYTWSGLRLFMARRFTRIAPPAYVAALFMILFYYSAIIINGHPVEGNEIPAIGWRSVIGNLTFLAEYMDTLWFNFVYWSLTAEFEFYLVIGLMFPLLRSGSPTWRVALLLVAVALSCLIPGPKFFHYSAYFLLGMLIYLWQETTTSRALLIAVGLLTVTLDIVHDHLLAISVSLVATGIIATRTTARTAVTDWLGKVSYSLYIIHVPVAYFAESIVKRLTELHTTPMGKLVLLAGYLILSFIAAELFHRWVERPFINLSKRLGQAKDAAPATT